MIKKSSVSRENDRMMTQKGRHFLEEKIGVTPSVSARDGNTNLSDATVCRRTVTLPMTAGDVKK